MLDVSSQESTQQEVDVTSGPKLLRVNVVDDCGNELIIQLKMTTLMDKLKLKYANYFNIKMDSVYFLFVGRRIEDDETPEKLGLRNGDFILVYRK